MNVGDGNEKIWEKEANPQTRHEETVVNPDGVKESQEEKDSISRYFSESISAETTFELSESNTKLLSLPAGSYNYSVYEYPTKLGAKMENNLVDQGIITWNGSHQGLNIAKAPPSP